MKVRGVLFDLDGVLVDSEHLWEEAWSDVSRLHETPWSDADTARVQGMSVGEWSRDVAGHLGLGADGPAQVAEHCVSFVVDRAAHDPDVELLDGALALLGTAAAHAPVALASSAARRVIDAMLDRHGIGDRFLATVSSEEVARGKPHPDVYAEAARRLGVAPGACVAFEDSGNGIRAAAAAGARVIAIPNAHYPPAADVLALARHVADDHTHAERLLRHELALEETR